MKRVSDVRPLRVKCTAALYFGGHCIPCAVDVSAHELSMHGRAFGQARVMCPVPESGGIMAGVEAARAISWEGLCEVVAELFGLGPVVVVSVMVEPVGTLIAVMGDGPSSGVAALTVSWREVAPDAPGADDGSRAVGVASGSGPSSCSSSCPAGSPVSEAVERDSLWSSLAKLRGEGDGGGKPS